MISRCTPSTGQVPRPPGGASGFRLVLGQPGETKGEALAATQDETLKNGLAEDLDGTFESLVIAYQDRLYSFALRLTGRREDAEEVAQDAFVRAYRALGTLHGGADPCDGAAGLALPGHAERRAQPVPRQEAQGRLARPPAAGRRRRAVRGGRRRGAAARRAVRAVAQARRHRVARGRAAGALPRAAHPALRRGAAPGRGGPRAQAAGGNREVQRASGSHCPARSPYGVASRKKGVRK